MKVAKKEKKTVVSASTKHVPELYNTEVYRTVEILCDDVRGTLQASGAIEILFKEKTTT